MSEVTFTLLYSTRERHPTFRVDLVELFSAGLAVRAGHRVDWHMQSAQAAPASLVRASANERVFVGAAVAGKGVLGKLRNHLAAWRHDLRLYRLVRRGDYDFVQVRDKVLAGLVCLAAARARRIPFFYWMSFPYPEADLFRAGDPAMDLPWTLRAFYRLRGRLTRWLLYRVVLPRADHVFVQSERMREDVAACGIDPGRMTAVPMGVNVARIREAAARDGDAAEPDARGRRRLVYVGTLVRVRRIDLLLDVLRRVRAAGSDAMLELVGDGPEPDVRFLREEARRLGLAGHVRFTGFLPPERAWAHIRRAEVCLSPFRPSPILDSTSPTKVIEYLACGRPVVANRHPDQAKVLGESGAGLVVDYDPQAFADAVLELLAEPERARAMGRRGVDYVGRHRSYDQLSRRLEARYRELLAGNGAFLSAARHP